MPQTKAKAPVKLAGGMTTVTYNGTRGRSFSATVLSFNPATEVATIKVHATKQVITNVARGNAAGQWNKR